MENGSILGSVFTVKNFIKTFITRVSKDKIEYADYLNNMEICLYSALLNFNSSYIRDIFYATSDTFDYGNVLNAIFPGVGMLCANTIKDNIEIFQETLIDSLDKLKNGLVHI